MPSIRFLHLSDLHVGSLGWEAGWKSYLNEFSKHLKDSLNKGETIDLVLITGDLTSDAEKHEFFLLTQAIDDLIGIFDELGNIPKFVVVPGNHDFKPIRADITKQDGRDKQKLIDELCGWRVKVQQRFWFERNNFYLNIIKENFGNYKEWWDEQIKKTHFQLDNVQTGEIPGDISATYKKEDFKLGIIGLNSAFLQLSHDRVTAPLILDANQFEGVCQYKGDNYSWLESHHTSLLLTHHSPHDLHEDSQRYLTNNIASPAYLRHLCGHMGQTLKRDNILWQVPSFFGKRLIQEEAERTYGYRIGVLKFNHGEKEARLEGHLMQYIPAPQRGKHSNAFDGSLERIVVDLNFLQQQEISPVQEETTPIAEEPPKQQETTPIAEELPKQQETTPVAEEPPKQQETTPITEEPPKQQETTPIAEEPPKQQETTPVAEEPPKQQETTPVAEEPPKQEETTPIAEEPPKQQETPIREKPPKEAIKAPVLEVKPTIFLPIYVYQKFIQDNVVDVRGYMDKENLTGGTGFLFAENLLVTCFHCVGDRSSREFYNDIHITNIDSSELQLSIISKLSSIEHDYAILYIDNPQQLKCFDTISLTHKHEETIGHESIIKLQNDTKFYGYGFSDLNPDKNQRDNTPILDAEFIAEMQLPTLDHPIIYAFNTKQAILKGQSGSPICPYQQNKPEKANVIAMCQGYNKLGGFLDPKMYTLPMEVLIKNYHTDLNNIRAAFNSSCDFIKVELNAEEKYFITTKVFTIEALNQLFGMQLIGINGYVAQRFSQLLGFSIPTKEQFCYAVRAGAFKVGSGNKEWIIETNNSSDNSLKFLLATQANKGDPRENFAEQRPEAYADNYVFRLVSDKPV